MGRGELILGRVDKKWWWVFHTLATVLLISHRAKKRVECTQCHSVSRSFPKCRETSAHYLSATFGSEHGCAASVGRSVELKLRLS